MKYIEVIFQMLSGEEWQKDLLVSDLADIGFDTFEDTESGFAAYIPAANLDLQALETLMLHLDEGLEVSYKVQEIENQNWNKLWESNFNPIEVGGQCYVRATFHEARPDFPYEIIIDPKMSFGTGHHQTTSMMLQYILENDFEGKQVLDMGCGTGILAILASKKGADALLAVDYDEICVDSVIENSALNTVTNIEAICGSFEVLKGRVFDTILANINRNILLEQLPQYALSININGELYLSGFYEQEDLAMLRETAESLGFEFISKKVLNNWCAAKFVKR
ncbi:MAG: ribosomal protein methyltransferase [Sphingobacterium sp.]|jgi:ribosomal protein L11 methyltransferase|uniref:50S ribosomal protein L11 methyltransferase n=1 Tax=unclassified Sphingobacterium TaxID=2609468 RepID=UPI00098568DA|nr:50S ribosomal protein L11 methyltransferase [Sphingobacterium sp. CZ-UAM]MDF2519238.1 ribosomal protein methyltransferase [Sphingobacterium sp.]OOG17051.1 ribosomal protein L11 methyltransferase [Sphingobacterium sp. CZ-UAM]